MFCLYSINNFCEEKEFIISFVPYLLIYLEQTLLKVVNLRVPVAKNLLLVVIFQNKFKEHPKLPDEII